MLHSEAVGALHGALTSYFLSSQQRTAAAWNGCVTSKWMKQYAVPLANKAELSVLHTAVTTALRTALNRFAGPQQIGLMLGLALIAQDVTRSSGA
jgi:hypothetical protein